MTKRKSDNPKLDRILAEELPPDSQPSTVAPYNASEAITQGRPRAPIRGNLTPYQPGESGNPGGVPREAAAGSRYTVSRALREALTVGEAKRIAQTAIELAAQGSPRHMEYVRDTTEGKPGVRITDGEWDPASSAVFQQVLMLRQQTLVAIDERARDNTDDDGAQELNR